MKAIVIGATGLVGKSITEQLLKLPEIREVLVFSRRSSGIQHSKLRERIVDFDNIDGWKNEIRGDILFSALGTTLKAAGSKEAQFRVDHDYQLEVAQSAVQNGVDKYVLISSVNASKSSPFFYLKMKGELDDKVMNLGFSSVCILRPGPLRGHREKPRLSELISTRLLGILPVSAGMKPVDGSQVARVAIDCGLKRKGLYILEAEEILKS
jgi:uncharacterized protein YbjT (DUF2867 family)